MSKSTGKPVLETITKMSDEDKQFEHNRVLAEQPCDREFWIFGFGSLMWRPGLDVKTRVPGTLRGYERKFEIWSTVGRGTFERPGLGCCLIPGPGLCRGIAYELKMSSLSSNLAYLWEREMGSGVYRPTWVKVEIDNGFYKNALTFVVRKGHPQHTGPMSPARMAEIIGRAKGKNGECRDYLVKTLAEMKKLGQYDPLLEDVMKRINSTAGYV